MNEPLGRRHPTIRRLRALRRDPALRRSEGVFLAEGLHLAAEALREAASIEFVVSSPRLAERSEGRRLLEAIDRSSVTRVETSDAILESAQDARSPQPVLAVVRRPEWPLDAGLAGVRNEPLVVVAHALQDPGNLGGLVRTADAAGATALYVCGPAADPFHPRAVRATMGSIFRLPVIVDETETALERLRAARLQTVGSDVRGDCEYDRLDFRGPTAVFFGREAQGLPASLLARLDERCGIPMREGVESLSVGAAAAVLLFHAALQRRGSW